MDKPELSNDSTYLKIKKACEYILNKENKRNAENTLPNTELFQRVQSEFPSDFPTDFSKNTFTQYLSNTVKDTESTINCLGRRKGYYLSSVAEEIAPEETSEKVTEEKDSQESPLAEDSLPRKRIQKEALLYTLLESWLVAQGYQSQDVSAGRSLGKWGNPDVAGISALDSFNGLSIELVTIEAKVSLDDWEKWIFEAVSHKRFANRSYFAFAHPEETVTKIPQDREHPTFAISNNT